MPKIIFPNEEFLSWQVLWSVKIIGFSLAVDKTWNLGVQALKSQNMMES